MIDDRTDRYLVIGAGAAGLAAARRLSEAGIAFEVVDGGKQIGGLWAMPPEDGPLYRNTHLISPKSLQAFADFPMPAEYPDFPHHSLALRYLQSYAAHHKLDEKIELGVRVSNISPNGHGWHVALADGTTRKYKGVLIASGKHSTPSLPKFEGAFDGEILHCREYSDPASLRDKRVLVIGCGQSAIDLVAESAVVARRTIHSTRRGLFSMPRYLLGKPFEEHLQGDPPLRETFARWSTGLLKRLGAAPKQLRHAALSFADGFIHPTVGREFFRFYEQGDVTLRGPVHELDGRFVTFADGSREEIDVIYCATGYRLEYPFIDRALLQWRDGAPRPDLFLHTFPDSDSLFVLGMMQPLGAHWTTYDEQAQLVVDFLRLRERGGPGLEEFRRRRRAERPRLDGGIDFYARERKGTPDVDKLSFRAQARKLRRRMQRHA
ncbi:MAG TPA: NAD(P)-binding domain-containing protein [Thermoanaerobaculia bacterium]|nr:NAD(P)-binding domain-containing protein [Thermoanaerobaculia bacterium]